MEGKETTRLESRILTSHAQPRRLETRQEAENKCGDGKVEMSRGRADGSAQQQQRNTNECDECSRQPESLHASIVTENQRPWTS